MPTGAPFMSNYDMSGQEVSQERLRGCVNAFIYPGAIPAQDAEQSVPDCFEKVVALHSNRLAIKTARHALTYDALNKAANRVARVVLEKSRDSDLPVVVVFDHDAPIVVAILAVVKAGKTCVVLDPSYPEQRAAHIIEDSQAKLILVDSQSGRLARWLRTEEITIYISTPSLFRSLVATLTGQEEFSKLRTIRLGAEQIRKSDIELYKRYFSEKCLLALFLSATEVGNLCQYFVDKEAEIPGDIIPAGHPVDGIDILLLD